MSGGLPSCHPDMGEDVPMTQGSAPSVDPAPEGEPIPAQGISVQGTAIVGVGLAVSQVIAMLQMLVVARILGPEQYGVFGAMAVVLLIGSTVAGRYPGDDRAACGLRPLAAADRGELRCWQPEWPRSPSGRRCPRC